MDVKRLLPDPRKVRKNDMDTLFDLRRISHQYRMGRITATEAMAQIDERFKKHDEDYDNMYRAFYDALKEEETE